MREWLTSRRFRVWAFLSFAPFNDAIEEEDGTANESSWWERWENIERSAR